MVSLHFSEDIIFIPFSNQTSILKEQLCNSRDNLIPEILVVSIGYGYFQISYVSDRLHSDHIPSISRRMVLVDTWYSLFHDPVIITTHLASLHG